MRMNNPPHREGTAAASVEGRGGGEGGGYQRHAWLAVPYTPRHTLAWLHVRRIIKGRQSALGRTAPPSSRACSGIKATP